jgi:hypothetical protein
VASVNNLYHRECGDGEGGWALGRLLALLLMEKQADVSSGQKEERFGHPHSVCVSEKIVDITQPSFDKRLC